MEQKEAIKILIHLINLAQRKGAYSMDEAYLAFHAITSVVEDSKLEEVKKAVATLESGGSAVTVSN